MKVKGFIDSVSNHRVQGWVFSEDSNDAIEVELFANNTLIGSGVTNVNRPDVEKKFNCKSNVGFDISINPIHFLNEKTLEISAKIKTIDESEFDNEPFASSLLSPQETSFFVKNVNLQGTALQVFFENPIYKETTLVLVIDNEYSSQISLGFGMNQVIIPLHSKYFDGEIHAIELYEFKVIEPIFSELFLFKNYFTPETFLENRNAFKNQISPDFKSLYRQQSLNLQLDNNDLSKEQIVAFRHFIATLEKGFQPKDEYEKITLPKQKSPVVSIIIPTYNKFELVYHCINSILLSYNTTSYEIIIADDCSEDQTTQATSIIENVVVSRNKENLGFLRSCNVAARLAKGEYIVFLNNDTEVTSFWLDELINPILIDNKIAITGSKLINLDGSLQEAGGIVWSNGNPWNVRANGNRFSPEYNYVREAHYVSGASFCIKKEVWEKVGGFSEEFAPAYYEDTDLCFKVRQAGYKVCYTPFSEIVHFEGFSNGTDINSGIKQNQVINAGKFKSKWAKAFREFEKEGENLHFSKDLNKTKWALVLDYATPVLNQDAGSYAAIQEIKILQSFGFKVTFIP